MGAARDHKPAPLLTVKDVMERLGLPRRDARALMMRLPYVRLGTGPRPTIVLAAQHLDAFVAGNANAEKHGLRDDRRAELFASQGGRCRICRCELKERGNGNDCARVDHCHASGVIRGILCNGCNAGLGMFRDQPELLRAAAEYLEAWRLPAMGA